MLRTKVLSKENTAINKSYVIELQYDETIEPLNYYHYLDDEQAFRKDWINSGNRYYDNYLMFRVLGYNYDTIAYQLTFKENYKKAESLNNKPKVETDDSLNNNTTETLESNKNIESIQGSYEDEFIENIENETNNGLEELPKAGMDNIILKICIALTIILIITFAITKKIKKSQ